MATFYVSSGSGDDSDNGTTPALAKKTLGSVLGLGMDPGDTIEILDEETYPEYNIAIDIPGLTITHTASHLGRPKVDALGQARMWIHNTYGTTFHNIEMYNSSTTILRLGTGRAGEFHLTGCYAHGMQYLLDNNIDASAATNKTSIDNCILYFNNTSNAAIKATDDVVIKNSLITGSSAQTLFSCSTDTTTCTASFSTFIRRGASSDPIVQTGKVIDCIVSGTGDGIASDDHTYNLVIAGGANFRNAGDTDDGTAGTGDLEDQDPLFVDGTAIGTGSDIANNFQLQKPSPCINAGITYDDTTTDLDGNLRIQSGWTPYSAPTLPSITGDFTINLYNNISVQYKRTLYAIADQGYDMGAYEYQKGQVIVTQVPFSLGQKGPGTLRGRLGAYGASKGGNPSTIIQTSSA